MTDVDICNLALGYLGDPGTVTSINPPDGSAQAQHCARFYPMAVSLLLEMHDWNFITTRVSLALLSTCPYDEWRFAYAMPPAVNSVISVKPLQCYAALGWESWRWLRYGGSFEWEDSRRDDFQIEIDSQGDAIILSNACDAIARYTTTQATSGQFSASFAEALAWKLASMLAGPMLKGDAGAAESKRCMAMFAAAKSVATMQDVKQKHGNLQPVPAWIAGR